jgi:hypothetical protein
MYNSVLNAPMLREDNKLRRDDFFNNAQNQIQQLSGLDLSLAQNVDAAAQVFAPFYEDEGIVKDMGFTKKYQDEMQRAEYLRNCTDPKKCGDKYWSGGVRAMNYQAEDFINASAEDALKMAAPKYTEYYNLMKNAQAAIKDAGLSMKITSKNGQYLVTTKNGSQLTMPLMNFMMSRFGDDPRLQEFYSTKAMLLTRENPEAANAAYLKAMQNPGMPQEQVEQQAQDESFTQTYSQAKNTVAGTANREENRFMNMVRKKDVLEERIRKNGVVPGSPEANEFLASVRDANMQEGVVEDLNNMNTAATNTDGSLQELGLAANKDQMRNVIANAMKINDMYNTANTLAYKDYERTMVADPFALQNNSFNNSMTLASVKNNFALQKQAYDYIYKKGLKELDAAVTNGSTGTSINWWSRPSNNYSDRLNQFYQTGDASGQAPTPTVADQLSTNILAGMSNPMSYVSTQPEKIAMLMQEGRFEEANQVAQGNVVQGNAAYDPASPVGTGVLFNKPPKTIQEITYDWTKAGDGVNIMKSTLARFARLKTRAANDWIPFNERGDVSSGIDHSWLTIDQMTEAFSGARGYTAEQINKWKTSSTEEKTRINKEILNTQFNIAGDETNPESDAMQLEMLDLTSHIDANFKHWGKLLKKTYGGDISKDYAAYTRMMNDTGMGSAYLAAHGASFPHLTKEEFKVLRWGMPTNTNQASEWAVTSKQFRKIKNIGIDKLISLSGGNDGLFQFNEDAGGIWTINDESIDEASRLTINNEGERPADELMSHSDYAKYTNLRQEEAGNLNEDGTYVNPELSPEMINKLNRYEQFTGATNFERKWGVGSGIAGIQFLNATHAAYKVNIANQDAGAQNAIDKFNTGLNNSANQLNPQTTSIDGRIWNAIKDKIVVQGGEGELSRLATKSELNGILAESIPDLLADPSWAQRSNVLHGKWGLNFNEFKSANMNDGKTSTKSMLNLLSVSNYASKDGASKGMFSGATHPSWDMGAADYNLAIAGLKMQQDWKLPLEERKYINMAAAIAETKEENPYTRTQGNLMVGEANQVLLTTSPFGGNEASHEAYNTQAQEYLQFLAKYEDAISTEYVKGGKEFNVTPNFEMYDRYKSQSDPATSSFSKMGFDMGMARIDEAWINVFEDHENTIGTAYEELLNNFTNQESSFGGMFTGDDGTPVGQGTMVAAPGTMKAIGPSRKNQNYFDSQYILDEAVKRGNFGTDVYGATILNELSASLKTVNSYSKGKEPLWDLEVHPMSGEYGTTKYTLEFLNPKWLQEQGYNKTKSGDIIEDTKRPMSYTWTVENATDPLSTGSHPTSWDATVGSLGTGETYTNTALQKDYGNIHYRKTDDGAIQPGYTIDLFNPESGEEEEISFYAPSQAYYGTDWIEQQINLVDEMIQAKAISEDTKRQYTMLRGIKNPDELLQNMAEQFGVTVEELLQSFN